MNKNKPWIPEYPRISRLIAGLNILNDYVVASVNIEPIPNSFPNGAPNHSSGAYLAICLSDEKWPMNDVDEKRMLELGWKSEQEGIWWVFQ